jgi:hypothetical protein
MMHRRMLPTLHRLLFVSTAAAALAATAAFAQAAPAPDAPVAASSDSSGPAAAPAPRQADPSLPWTRIGSGKRPEKTYTFQVVLLVADDAAPAVVENVPPNAQRALKDLQDFLPYKSYHLVDLAWLRTAWWAKTRITGPKGEAYEVELDFQRMVGAGERLLIQDFKLTEKTQLPPVEAGGRGAGKASAVREVLSTTFGMELGETVVVGTAKLDGPGRALIVLLSASPGEAAGRRR